MIPAMILFGLVCGRWWKQALIAATIIWPLLLLVDGALQGAPGSRVAALVLAVVLAVLNAGVGVAIHQALLHLVRALRSRSEVRI